VYIPVEDARVIALRVDTGVQIWERRLGAAPNEMLALDERIYVGSDDNFLYCLEADDGEIAWRWRTGADVIGVPVADDDRVYFVSLDNVLRGLDLKSGAQRWKRALPSRPTRGPVRVGDVLLVSGLSTKVSAFSMRDGTPAGELVASGELAAPPYTTEVLGLPQVVIVSRDIEVGTRVAAMRRNIEPEVTARLPTLPNPITVALPPRTAGGARPSDAPASGDTPGGTDTDRLPPAQPAAAPR
jgi:outer membrane protein assembly factor BamB